MAATRSDVDRWIEAAKEMGATHIVSVCDTYNWDDYPVYVMPNENVNSIKESYNKKSMQKVNEIITINSDGTVEEQINR